MMWLPHEVVGPRDHVLHADTTLLIVSTLSLSLNRLPASRLLLPRSGLERSDFVLWHKSDAAGQVLRCPLWMAPALQGLN